jgi:hypothetical protein
MHVLRHSVLTLVALTLACAPAGGADTVNPTDTSATEVAQDVRAASVKFQPIDPVSFWDQFRDKPVPHCRDIDQNDQCSDLEILSNFPNDATQVAVFQLDVDGQVKAPFVTSSARGSVYRVIVDYVKYRTDSVDDCIFRSGVGIRLKAELTTTSAKADISSPIGIGLSAQLGRIRGSLSFETIGVSGKAITPLVPIPSQISAESIQKAIEAAASIKAVLYSSSAGGDVVVDPQVFALKCKTRTPTEAVVPQPGPPPKKIADPLPEASPP